MTSGRSEKGKAAFDSQVSRAHAAGELNLLELAPTEALLWHAAAALTETARASKAPNDIDRAERAIRLWEDVSGEAWKEALPPRKSRIQGSRETEQLKALRSALKQIERSVRPTELQRFSEAESKRKGLKGPPANSPKRREERKHVSTIFAGALVAIIESHQLAVKSLRNDRTATKCENDLARQLAVLAADDGGMRKLKSEQLLREALRACGWTRDAANAAMKQL